MSNLIAHALIKNSMDELLILKRTLTEQGKENYEGGKWDNLLLGGFFLKLTKYKEYAIIRQTGGLRFEKICYCRISIGYSVSFEYFIAIAYPKAFQFLGGNNELYQGRRCAAAEHY